MTPEKQFIKKLNNIKEYCRKTKCIDCKFEKGICQVRFLVRRLDDIPMNWNIEKIEEIINE